MKVLLILGALVAATAASTAFVQLVVEEWNTFKTIHEKSFENDVQDKIRMKVFIANRIKIARHNARYARGEVSYELEVNRFTDMLSHEFVNVMNGFNRTARNGGTYSGPVLGIQRLTYLPSSDDRLPETVDWREVGAVTPIKDQGQCGSCYSFSATGALEGQTFLKKGRLVSLSEQNIMDCTQSYGNMGCHGGFMDGAFKYIKDNGGVDTEESYPYLAKVGRCHYNPRNKGATDTGIVDIPTGNEELLKHAVAKVGPVSVAIDASHLQFYKNGVYYNEQCQNDSDHLDHGVLVVGYGSDNGTDYWLIKNSWGERWGEKGYFRLARNKNNHCGIATSASYPLVDDAQ